MLLSGISSAHTIIPVMPEMIESGVEDLNYPEKVLNDYCAGLFNMNFALGETLGPLIGNYMYTSQGMKTTCNQIGISIIVFAVIYFLMCDESIWGRSKKVKKE